MKVFAMIVLCLVLPPVGIAWVLLNILSKQWEDEDKEKAEQKELLKRATVALEKNAA
jgi:nitrogen fixation-related uncharacterized protein